MLVNLTSFQNPCEYNLKPIRVSAVTGTRIIKDKDGHEISALTNPDDYVETTLTFQILKNDNDTNTTLTNIKSIRRIMVKFSGKVFKGGNIGWQSDSFLVKANDGISEVQDGIQFTVTVGKQEYADHQYDMVEDAWHARGGISSSAIITIFVTTKSGFVYQIGAAKFGQGYGMDVNEPGLNGTTLILHMN